MTENVKRTILVTGGSRGIGRGICLAFAHPDNHIFFNYSSAGEAAAETEQLVADAAGQIPPDGILDKMIDISHHGRLFHMNSVKSVEPV